MSQTLKAEQMSSRMEQVGDWQLRICSYKLGDRYICTVDNVNPGAVISRAEAPTREAAEESALSEARVLIRRTRRLG